MTNPIAAQEDNADDSMYLDVSHVYIDIDGCLIKSEDIVTDKRIFFKPGTEENIFVTPKEPIVFRVVTKCEVTCKNEDGEDIDVMEEINAEFSVTAPFRINKKELTLSQGALDVKYRFLDEPSDLVKHLLQSVTIEEIGADFTAPEGLRVVDEQSERFGIMQVEVPV